MLTVVLLHSTANGITERPRRAATSHWKSSDATADTGAHAARRRMSGAAEQGVERATLRRL